MSSGLRSAVTLSAILLLIIALLAVIQLHTFTASTLMQRYAADFAHVPVFAAISFGLVWSFLRLEPRKPSSGYVRAAIGTLLLALFSETMQLYVAGRSVSLLDLAANTTGGAIGLLLASACFAPGSASRRRQLSLWAAGLLIALALARLAWAGAGYLYRGYSWPTLINGDSRLERVFLAAYNSSVLLTRRQAALDEGDTTSFHVERIHKAPYGLLIQEIAEPMSGYSQVCVDIENLSGKAVSVAVKLGNSPLFFRSTSFSGFSLPLAANSRQRSCRPLTSLPGMPARHETGTMRNHRSAALLVYDPDSDGINVYRLWFD